MREVMMGAGRGRARPMLSKSRCRQSSLCIAALAAAGGRPPSQAAEAKSTGWLSKSELSQSAAQPWVGYGESGYVGRPAKSKRHAKVRPGIRSPKSFSAAVRSSGYATKASKAEKPQRFAALEGGPLRTDAPRNEPYGRRRALGCIPQLPQRRARLRCRAGWVDGAGYRELDVPQPGAQRAGWRGSQIAPSHRQRRRFPRPWQRQGDFRISAEQRVDRRLQALRRRPIPHRPRTETHLVRPGEASKIAIVLNGDASRPSRT